MTLVPTFIAFTPFSPLQPHLACYFLLFIKHAVWNGGPEACTNVIGVCMSVCASVCESVHVSESECVRSTIIYHCHLASPKFEEAPRDAVQMPLSNTNKCLYFGPRSVLV